MLSFGSVQDARESFWSARLSTGKVVTERQLTQDWKSGGYRRIDWQNDINATGDLKRIKELHLISQGYYVPSYACTWKDVVQGGDPDPGITYTATFSAEEADKKVSELRADKKKAAVTSTLSVEYIAFKQHEMIKIDDDYTAFQFKHRTKEFFNSSFTTLEAQCIGRITNKATGDCDCYIWDRFLGMIHYHSNVFNFGTWRKGLIPLKDLGHDVLGIRI